MGLISAPARGEAEGMASSGANEGRNQAHLLGRMVKYCKESGELLPGE